MTALTNKLKERADRKSSKREDKKRQIAASAIKALVVLGYANTSLRDIAEQSDMSLGMLHYYFEDKIELITYCVTRYKEDFISQLDGVMEQAESAEQAEQLFHNLLVHTIITDAATHRLWFDIRTQSLFDEVFLDTVTDLEKALVDVVQRVADRMSLQADAEVLYALVNGMFRIQMQRYTSDKDYGREEVEAGFAKTIAAMKAIG